MRWTQSDWEGNDYELYGTFQALTSKDRGNLRRTRVKKWWISRWSAAGYPQNAAYQIYHWTEHFSVTKDPDVQVLQLQGHRETELKGWLCEYCMYIHFSLFHSEYRYISIYMPVCRNYTEHEHTTLLDISTKSKPVMTERKLIPNSPGIIKERRPLLSKTFLMFREFQRWNLTFLSYI